MTWLVVALLTTATTATTSSAPHIDLYTMEQGPVLYERFGHAALCVVYDDHATRSRCYNYGTSTFSSASTMAWEFMRGVSRFWVSVTSLDEMIWHYRASDRTIYRQRLPLDSAQAAELARRLAHDALEDNRYYMYRHFADNCSTRVRDHIDRITGGALSRGDDRKIGVSYRELGRRGLAEMTGLVVAAHFVLGRAADHEPSGFEAMFLPRFLRDGVAQRLGAAPELIYERRGPPFPETGSSGRWWLLLIGAAIAAPAALSRALGRGYRLGLAISAGLLAVLGLKVWGVALVSHIVELRLNEALLVFTPTDILLAILGPFGRRRYAQLRMLELLLVSIAVAVGLLHQPLLVPLLIPAATCAVVATGSFDRRGSGSAVRASSAAPPT
jgi:hypothetical protein